ncbi:MAG: hypothetical protein IPM24_21825 [Bryobacterales bacterium]|nr:hypothetical protein [Bryobacterales bacterium]
MLTHDVEGARGLDRVDRLMALESRLGFRSCFNLVPEGEYRVPHELLDALRDNGFEVGLHGLKHDGKLYSSKAEFGRRAVRIRDYLSRWKIAGFRSPFMQHQLGWLHILGAEYDGSTFDTDPFEPQPDAAATVFPFWVPAPGQSGYVELPCTMVQDFTLFTVLGESAIDVWKRKLDWIASRRGMVLLNTHPDYMDFGPNRPARDEYPASHYEEMLNHIRQEYEGLYWHALPQDVARYYTGSLDPARRNTRKKVCFVVPDSGEAAARARRYAAALTARGDLVETISCVGSGVAAAAREIIRRHRETRFDLVQFHDRLDLLCCTAWPLKWSGAKLALDLSDLPCTRFTAMAGALADHVIASDGRVRDALNFAARAKCSVEHHVPVAVSGGNRLCRDDTPLPVVAGNPQDLEAATIGATHEENHEYVRLVDSLTTETFGG